MKLFITGATGFIGTHLTKKLVNEGNEVSVLLRTESKRKLLPENISVIKGDMSLLDLKKPPPLVVVMF